MWTLATGAASRLILGDLEVWICASKGTSSPEFRVESDVNGRGMIPRCHRGL